MRPEHYKKGGVEPIDVMRAKFSKEKLIGFLEGNVLKYLMRYEEKNGLDDLKKAKQYMDWLIEVQKGPEGHPGRQDVRQHGPTCESSAPRGESG